jgi:hypothetical protein
MWEQLRNTFLQNMITNLNTAWSWASNIFADYQEKMESPEMVSLWDDAASKQEEIEKVSADIDSMRKQVEEEYEWTWASRAKINAIVADRTYDLQLQLRSLNSEYNRIATQYNNRMTQYQNEFQLQLQEYQINMQERNQKMNELWFAMDLMTYETPQQKQEREWNYWVKQQEYQNWDINSKDYSTRYKAALKWVENLLSQYPWIPMERSAEQMAEDVLKAVDAGSTLWAELTNINKLIQKKPEYKKLYNASYWTWSSVIEDTFKSGNTEWVKYNGQWYTSDEFNKIFGSNNKQKAYTQVDEKVFNPISTKYQSTWYNTLGWFLDQEWNQAWKKWWQCGKFVNDYLQYIWVTDSKNRYYDDNLSTKLASVNSYTPTVWSVAVFDYNHKSSDWINHGHVGIVTKVYEDWSFDVIDSNYDTSKPNTITKRHVNAWQWSTKWFFNPSIASNATSSDATWAVLSSPYQQERVWLYNAYIQNWTMPSDAKLKAIWWWDLAKWIDLFDAEVRSYIWSTWMWTDSKTAREEITSLRKEFNQQSVVKDYMDMKNSYAKLIASNNDTAAWDLSLIFSYMKILDPGSVVREWEFANAQNAWWISDKIRNTYNKVLKWTRLTDKQRNEFIEVAGKIMDWYTEQYNQLLDQYKSYSTQGWDVNQIWKVWLYVTDEYINRYNQPTATQVNLWFSSSVDNLISSYSVNK